MTTTLYRRVHVCPVKAPHDTAAKKLTPSFSEAVVPDGPVVLLEVRQELP